MEQYLARVQDDIRPGVVKPKIGNDVEFEINSNFMRELRRKLFKGINDEDAYEHVQRVLEIAYLFHFSGVTHDVVMLRVFPITLKGPALRWINKLSVGLVTTWDLLEKCVYVCVYVDYVGVGTQSIERDRLIGIGVVLDNSFRSLLSDGEMIIEI
ncbi:hypothetical protein Tco_1359517 [Tanacetum coccineum]